MTGLVDVLGLPVVTDGRVHVGRIQDLIVLADVQHPAVSRVVVAPRHGQPVTVLWADVLSFGPDGLVIRETAWIPGIAALQPGELLLNRDVLDTQVVDLNGLRVARVSNVILATGDNGSLSAMAVDIGIATVFKRLGLWRSRKRSGVEAIDWNALHLTSRRGHEVQLATASSAVHRLEPPALAHLLNSVSSDHAADIVEAVGHARTSEALALSHPRVADRLLLRLRPDRAKEVIEHLPSQRRDRYHRLIDEPSALVGRRFRRLTGWRHNRPSAPHPSTDVS